MRKIAPSSNNLTTHGRAAVLEKIHSCSYCIAVRRGSDQFNQNRMVLCNEFIFKNRHRCIEVRHGQIDITIAIIVSCRRATTFVNCVKVRTVRCLLSLKSFSVESKIEGKLHAGRGVWKLDHMSIGHHNVGESVCIKIFTNCSKADKQSTKIGDSVSPAHVQKLSPPFVAIDCKIFPLIVGHPDVGKTVAIKVAQINSHTSVGNSVVIERHATQKPTFLK